MTRLAPALITVLLSALLAGCSDSPAATPEPDPRSTVSPPADGPSTPPGTSTPEAEAEPAPRVSADDVRNRTALRAVQHLAGEIGSRPGHTPAYFRAADWVEDQLSGYGFTVERQRFPTPAGTYEGVSLPAGPSVNVIASRGDVRPGKPWLAVGAHLDTVPQGPGAEDNGSGVGAMLAVAEAVAERRTRLPVVFVAFGSEEPRGPSDDEHHFGSQAYVASLTPAERRSLRGMVSLDRVGVGAVMPVGSPELPNVLNDEVVAAARRAGAATVVESGQRSSDHWSFVRNGLPGVRLGSTPYAAYHSAADVPSVINPEQLARAGRITAAWLR